MDHSPKKMVKSFIRFTILGANIRNKTNGSQQDPFIELFYKNQKVFTTSADSSTHGKWDEYIDFDYESI